MSMTSPRPRQKASQEARALRAMRAIVNYNWQDEQRDYDEQDDAGKDGHVFEHLTTVDAYLRAKGIR